MIQHPPPKTTQYSQVEAPAFDARMNGKATAPQTTGMT